jgi:hypothetical protein
MYSKTLKTLNTVIMKCTVPTLYIYSVFSFSLVHMKVRDSDVLASSSRDDRQRGQGKMSQVLGVLGLLDFTMLQPVLTWCAFWNL